MAEGWIEFNVEIWRNMTHTDTRLKALEKQTRRGQMVSHVIDVTDAITPEEARRCIDERLNMIQRSGSTSPLVVLDF